jgi:hypothetical protein
MFSDAIIRLCFTLIASLIVMTDSGLGQEPASRKASAEDLWVGRYFMYEKYFPPSGQLGEGYYRSRTIEDQMQIEITRQGEIYSVDYAQDVKLQAQGNSLIPIDDELKKHPRQLVRTRIDDLDVIQVANSFETFYLVRDAIPSSWKVTPHARELDPSLFPQATSDSDYFPESLMRPYATFINAAKSEEPWAPLLCLPKAVEWTKFARPADRTDYDAGMNAVFLREQFNPKIVSFTLGANGVVVICTPTTEMSWVQTYAHGWLIYQYVDRPLDE